MPDDQLRPGAAPQDIHVLPLAREVDRAVLPFFPQRGGAAILHAHRVILLVPATTAGRRIAAKVEEKLGAVSKVERIDLVTDREHPTADLEGVLHQLATVVVRELAIGNRVHINLSSGTKLIAFAAGLAGMAHIRPGNGSLYYVQPEGYVLSQEDAEEHGHSHGMLDVGDIPLIPLRLPTLLQLQVLTFLRHHTNAAASYRQLLQLLATIPGSGFEAAANGSPRTVRNWNNAITTRMVRTLLTPLQEQGLLALHAIGREKAVRLTKRGAMYAALGGQPTTLPRIAPTATTKEPIPQVAQPKDSTARDALARPLTPEAASASRPLVQASSRSRQLPASDPSSPSTVEVTREETAQGADAAAKRSSSAMSTSSLR